MTGGVTTRFSFYKQHFSKQRQAEIGKKSSKCEVTPWDWIIHILYPKIIGHILKKWAKRQVCLYSWDYAINDNENEDENEK